MQLPQPVGIVQLGGGADDRDAGVAEDRIDSAKGLGVLECRSHLARIRDVRGHGESR